MNRTSAVRQATAMALRTRQRAGAGITASVSPFDVCANMNVEVRYASIASMEGMLARHPRPTIIVSSLRPAGRQAFTCAHELGHLVLGHASTVDEACALTESGLAISQSNQEEVAADQFAAFLLMPKTAVQASMRVRGVNPETCPPEDLLRLATWFGVGFMTLVGHLCYGIAQISEARFKELRRLRPQHLRQSLLGQTSSGLVVVDRHWTREYVDTVAGDSVWFPDGQATCPSLPTSTPPAGGILLNPSEPGVFAVDSPHAQQLSIRCMRREYEGRALFRYLQEDDDDTGN